jgi:serine/threonine-protein kinase RsbT
MASEARVEITSTLDVINARRLGRALAKKIGFAGSEITVIAAAISEVARNIVEYARRGEIIFEGVENDGRRGLKIVARDEGPGIQDVDQAMESGYSTRDDGLGLGLPGAKWLMDEFAIESRIGRGTTVTMRKWASQHGCQNQYRTIHD